MFLIVCVGMRKVEMRKKMHIKKKRKEGKKGEKDTHIHTHTHTHTYITQSRVRDSIT